MNLKKLIWIAVIGLAIGTASVFATDKQAAEIKRLEAIQTAACADAKAENSLSKWQAYGCVE